MTDLLPVVMTVLLAEHRGYFPNVDIRAVRGSVHGVNCFKIQPKHMTWTFNLDNIKCIQLV